MNAEEFVAAVKRSVCEGGVQDQIELLESPPGRRPSPDLVQQSAWFKTLDTNQRSLVEGIIRRSVEGSVFGLFCVLDGARVIEGTVGEKGEFELWWVKGGIYKLISPTNSNLHELL